MAVGAGVGLDELLHGELLRRFLDARLVRPVPIASPAAGAEIAQAAPGGTTWELLGLFALLTTDATVANRRPKLVLDDGSLVYGRFASIANHVASVAIGYTWATASIFNQATIAGADVNIGIPAWTIGPTHRIRTLTDNLAAGDQYSAIVALVRELAPDRIRSHVDKVRSDLTALL